jgi:hypothetical protein
MNARHVARSLGLAIAGSIGLVSSSWATDVAVTDKSGQTMNLQEVVFSENKPELSLKLAGPGKESSDDVECSLQAAMLKEVARDTTAKGDSYRVKVVVTLSDGQQYRGEVSGSIGGESDLGKATVNFDKLAKAAFTRSAGDAEYAPAKGAISAQVTDKAGNRFEITAAAIGSGNRNQADKLTCSLGEITLSVPLDTVAKIENLGEVKQEYSTGTKLRLTLVSGRTLEVTTGSGNQLSGPFKYGTVEIPFGSMVTATLEKKK